MNILKISLLMIITWLITKDLYYINYLDNCYIAIVPSLLEFNNGTVKEGISILKNASPSDYKDLCNNVSLINPNPNCGGYFGGCFYYDQPRNIYSNIPGNDPALTAAVLVHEVCHLKQHKESRELSENECYTKDSKILGNIVQP
jgi:hypothetical protein